MLDGMFSFVLLDTTVQPARMIAARDPIGITTLYQGWNSSDPSTIYFASELKALHDECDQLITFPPGHYYDSATGKTERYYKPTWWAGDSGSESDIPHGPADLKKIRESLEKAVKKRLMSEVPYGVLLSGGLDSSLIAAIAARETEKVVEAQERGRSKARASSMSKKTVQNGDAINHGGAVNGSSDGLTGAVEDEIAEGKFSSNPSAFLDSANTTHRTFLQTNNLPSPPGLDYTPSALVYPALLTSSQPAKQRNISVPCTTNIPSQYKKVSMPYRMSSTISRHTMSLLCEQVHLCTFFHARSKLWA